MKLSEFIMRTLVLKKINKKEEQMKEVIITSTQLVRDIKLDIIGGKYKCISAYKIPDKPDEWLPCPKCNLTPLLWEYNNSRSTGCGCGKNEYNHFSIFSESIMSWVTRHGGSALEYNSHKLKENWNHWVEFGDELESREFLLEMKRW